MGILFVLALLQQADVEFYGLVDGLQADALVVAVDRAALFLGQRHSGETVDLIGDAAVVAGVGALDHQVGRGDAIPSDADRVGDLSVAVAVHLAHRTGVVAL